MAAPASPAWRLAMEQATEMRRRKTRESQRAAERLWLALVLDALGPPYSKPRSPVLIVGSHVAITQREATTLPDSGSFPASATEGNSNPGIPLGSDIRA